ncbi:hypothetical protein KFK09_014761 [Dendrobium nobile]|uniref:SWIM-type domain-containing protein n=1 Tax=Dendrobium nobile TaxID=94219 RepID=A0A8T3B414_DENNO|nr:hypothetical protein KFK09_014761 [Dendrobium nobile]
MDQSRRRYNGGKQRTVKLEKGYINICKLRTEIDRICPWLKGHQYIMYYHIYRTSPKEYKILTTDNDVNELINQLKGNLRVEIVVAVQEDDVNEPVSNPMEVVSVEEMVECSITKDLEVGTLFNDAKTFKNALRSVAIRNNFGVRIKASDKKRVIATYTQSFQIRRVDGVHTCPGVNRAGNRLATSAWVANEIQDLVKRHPDIPPKEIKSNLEKEYGLSVPYMKLWRAREQARDAIFGSVDDSYKWVPTLKAELLERNPGSHITYTFDSSNHAFQRFYVSFKVCADGFLSGCRPLISVDACHLKSKYLGMLLSANALDGNNGLFNIAYAVVETESKQTWTWFLTNLGVTIGTNLQPLAFILDMEKGLGDAIRDIYPEAEHRVCICHLWKNIKKKFHYKDGQKLQGLVWTAANAYTSIEFYEKLAELSNVSPTIHSYLLSLPYKWSRSQFMKGINHSANTNNFAESFNSWIVEARSKPVVDLVDIIRGMLMEQRAMRKMNSLTWHRELVPQAEEYIRNITTRKEHLIIRQSSVWKAEVEGIHSRHVVDVEKRECTCRVWDVTGFPCIHAVAFIGMKEHPLWHSYIDEHYYVARYRVAYDGAIATLPEKAQWKVLDDLVQIGVPNSSRPRGRPRKRRLINFLEKEKKAHKCGRCGSWGHHRSTCKNSLQKMSDEGTYFTQYGITRRDKLASRRNLDNSELEEFEYSYLDGL